MLDTLLELDVFPDCGHDGVHLVCLSPLNDLYPLVDLLQRLENTVALENPLPDFDCQIIVVSSFDSHIFEKVVSWIFANMILHDFSGV